LLIKFANISYCEFLVFSAIYYIYSQILDRLLYAQLDGEVKNKEDEIIILKNILKERDKK